MFSETSHVFWLAAGAIVLLGLVLGLKDILRFSLARLWAISGIAYVESTRKRVLWIAPLAVTGVILVCQLQNPVDEQDAIRQTIKFCIFAAGLLVSLMAIILACTNLPNEIENRVIYTIVTKPATRLEIVAGKILGFARVSASLLLIMGLLTWGYLHLRNFSLQRQIHARLLRNGPEDAASRATGKYYASAGLLHAKTYADSNEVQVYSRLPVPNDPRRWMFWSGEQDLVVPFAIQPQRLQLAASRGLFIRARVGFEKQGGIAPPATAPATAPTTRNLFTINVGPTPTPASDRPAMVLFSVLNENREPIIPPQLIANFDNVKAGKRADGAPFELHAQSTQQPLLAFIPPEQVAHILDQKKIHIQVAGGTNFEYSVDESSFELAIPGDPPENITDTLKPDAPAVLRGRFAGAGRQIRGDQSRHGALAVYSFHNAPVPSNPSDLSFELRPTIEREPSKTLRNEEDPTYLEISVTNRLSGASHTTQVVGESGRTAYFSVPANAVAGGNFDVVVRCITDGHWVGLTTHALQAVTANHHFGLNLAKSLLILWLLSVLISAIAVLSSTFVSWPIAIMLTLVLLMGHWCVNQLGDSTGGIGRQVATELGFRDPGQTKVVSSSVEALTGSLQTLSAILPDISRYSAIEHIERGVDIPPLTLADALATTFQFVIPILLLAYVILRFKEVAP